MYMLYYSDSHLNMLQTIFYPFPFTLCRCSIPGSFMAKVVFCIALLAQNCHFWKWMGMWLLNVTHDLLTRHHATCLQCMQLHKTVFVIIYHIPIPLIPFLGSFPCVPTIIIHNLICTMWLSPRRISSTCFFHSKRMLNKQTKNALT